MTLRDEMLAIERGAPSRQALVACADVANRALATDDLELALRARGIELYFASRLDLERHAITVAAEAIALWEQLERLPRLEDDVQDNMLYLLSAGCLVAMGKIDIPLSTCHELVATLRRVLDRFGSHHMKLWEVEAALAYLEGDHALLRDRVERIGPLLGWRSRELLGAGCPGCVVLELVHYLGPDPIRNMSRRSWDRYCAANRFHTTPPTPSRPPIAATPSRSARTSSSRLPMHVTTEWQRPSSRYAC